MSLIHVDTDALAHIAVALQKYGDDIDAQLTWLRQANLQLPDSWRGTSGQNAYNMLGQLLAHADRAATLALNLAGSLHQASQAFYVADLTIQDTINRGR